ncbi:MAG TPA: transposase [Steroidobacteraceae bacterium]|nr:transposase [Steroidobacteraceae bacterium]
MPCRPGFFLPVRVLSRFFRRRFLEELASAHARGELQFFGEHAELSDPVRFAEWLTPLRQVEWVVYAKRPFAGPSAVLAYLSRYTHRVAISNSRLIAHDERGVTFRWKDYPREGPHTLQAHDAARCGVHATLPPARATARLPSHPPLRPSRQRSSL